MRYGIYSIYDKVAGLYGSPFVCVNEPVAIRQFNHQIASNLTAEPTDFELYCLGEFDINSGCIAACNKPVFVVKGELQHA